MGAMDVFYLYPLSGERLKYFVNRDKELDYGMRTLAERNGEVLGVIGSTGSGKTSFLYALEDVYLRVNKSGKVKWTTGREFLSSDFEIEKEYDTVFIDDCMNLSDEEAKEIYRKIYDVANKKLVNIVYTDMPYRDYGVIKERNFATTTRFLDMDTDIDKAIEMFKERLKKGGYGSMFEEDALKHLAFRSVPNLRLMFQYGKEAYTSTGKVIGITVEEVDRAIMDVDMEKIKTLGEVAIAVVNVLNGKVRKGKYDGINYTNLLKLVREEVKRKMNPRTLNEAINELEEMGILVIKKEGRENYINTIYNLMGLDFKVKALDKSRGIGR